MPFVYLHGFNSDGHGPKYFAMQDHFRTQEVLSPDLPADPEAVVALLDRLHAQYRQEPVYLLGTSLGGFYAYYYHIKSGFPVFLFNPVMKPHETLANRIGTHRTYMKRRTYEFKTEYMPVFKQMTKEADWNYRSSLLHFFLATDDEVLDLSGIRKRFPKAAFLQHYDNAQHTFARFAEVLPEVERLAKQAGQKKI